MFTSIQDLVDRAFADPGLAGLLSRGDWYLVGSRVRGFHDELSDWDTALLTPYDPSPDERSRASRASLDRVFGIERPAGVPSDLRTHTEWRAAGGLEISVFGPAGRVHREEGGNPIWADDMANAVPLRESAGVGGPYRAMIAARFEDDRGDLRDDAYLRFRMSRNEAAATLARTDAMAQAITIGLCVQNACRFWLLAGGSSYPADKWLPATLEATGSAADLLILTRTVTDVAPADVRFDALWSLWRLIDTKAVEVGVRADLLVGSPFQE